MQSEINCPSEIDSLKQCISEAENNKIKAENVKLKARVAIANQINKKLVICITKNMTMY